jgi:hypothetical protein
MAGSALSGIDLLMTRCSYWFLCFVGLSRDVGLDVDQAIAPLSLDGAQVRSQGACIFSTETKRRHIRMAAH